MKPPGKSRKNPSPEDRTPRVTGAAGTTGMAPVKLSGQLMRTYVESAPATPELLADLSEMPELELPDLGAVRVEAPEIAPVEEADLLERFEQIRLDASNGRARMEGEPVQGGDELLLDIIGYVDGRILPFSTYPGLVTILEPGLFSQAFIDQMIGQPVGESVVVREQLPYDHPVPALREKMAVFAVVIRGAVEIYPIDPEDMQQLEQLERGPDLGTVMATIAEEIAEERADEAADLLVNLVLEEVRSRTAVRVPEEWIEEEIRQRWRESEGAFLAEMDLPRSEQEEALTGWLDDPGMREQTERRLAVAMILRKIAEREGIAVEISGMEGFLEGVAESLGTDLREVTRALKEDPGALQRVVDDYMHLQAIEVVMGAVQIVGGQ